MTDICRNLHTTSSSILRWVNSYTVCEIALVDFRDRIREALAANPKATMRSVSLAAGSDSMLSKIMNPEKKGGIRHPSIEKMEAIARALGVSPSWLVYGEGPADPIPDADELARMIERAMAELPVGVTYADYPDAVAASLRAQLE